MSSQTANNYKELLARKIIDYAADVFKIALMEPGFAFSRSAHEIYADISAFELATALGYTVGGATLAGITITNDAVLAAAIMSWNNASWPIVGGDLQAAGAIIYDFTVAAPDIKPIVGYIDFGSTMTTYNGGTFTIANIAVGHT